jgi:EAL domain-containing protein (putative c-di-GMP-specific phosphodiesterase class I)
MQRFPLDTIKIDRSFARGFVDSNEDGGLADSIIAMGKNLSLTVVAQGVETKAQADLLRKHACDEFQGFYLNKPMSAQQCTELLRAQSSSLALPDLRAAPRTSQSTDRSGVSGHRRADGAG